MLYPLNGFFLRENAHCLSHSIRILENKLAGSRDLESKPFPTGRCLYQGLNVRQGRDGPCRIHCPDPAATLQSTRGDVKLDRCYRGRDHLVCQFNALLTEAKVFFRSSPKNGPKWYLGT